MNADEILGGAEARIQEHRTAEAALRLVDATGRPMPHVRADVRLARHEFKIGANAFGVGRIEDAALRQAYADRFAALLNYATLPFYWGRYEPEPGRPTEAQLDAMADWCRENRITPKGHPLVWHEVFPAWAETMRDEDVIQRLEARVRGIVSRFKGRIDIWDVVNEATVYDRKDNAYSRWVGEHGPAACVTRALRWARESNPTATLLYNDFNLSPAFEKLVADLFDAAAPVNVVGIQSHLHSGVWPVERMWEVCETYARFGLPIHFTEATILSGRLKPPGEDWTIRRDDWPTTPEGEAAQLDHGRRFYTALFSHPAVEAITWWDFSDYRSWQGAPSGLVRADMSPKPFYNWLADAFRSRWTTNAPVTADELGLAKLRCFFGEYEVVGRTPSGDEVRGAFAFRRKGTRETEVTMR